MGIMPIMGVSQEGCAAECPQNQDRDQRHREHATSPLRPKNSVQGRAAAGGWAVRHQHAWYRSESWSSMTELWARTCEMAREWAESTVPGLSAGQFCNGDWRPGTLLTAPDPPVSTRRRRETVCQGCGYGVFDRPAKAGRFSNCVSSALSGRHRLQSVARTGAVMAGWMPRSNSRWRDRRSVSDQQRASGVERDARSETDAHSRRGRHLPGSKSVPRHAVKASVDRAVRSDAKRLTRWSRRLAPLVIEARLMPVSCRGLAPGEQAGTHAIEVPMMRV